MTADTAVSGKKKVASLARLRQLARPKISKAVWATIEPTLVWGNQDPMPQISEAVKNAQCSQRVSTLATPKKNFQLEHPLKQSRDYYEHSCGRSSVILDVSKPAMQAEPSCRIEQLSQPKLPPCGYHEDRPGYTLGCGRSSPIWEVSKPAMVAEQRAHTERLAQPKCVHSHYHPPREVQRKATPGSSRDRTEELAKPKIRRDMLLDKEPQWRVTRATLRAAMTARIGELSVSKKLTDGYQPSRDVEWKVPRAVLKAKATQRVADLASPIIRDTMDHVQFDPLAFQVKTSALKGKVPDRIHNLAEPVIRGMAMEGKKKKK